MIEDCGKLLVFPESKRIMDIARANNMRARHIVDYFKFIGIEGLNGHSRVEAIAAQVAVERIIARDVGRNAYEPQRGNAQREKQLAF